MHIHGLGGMGATAADCYDPGRYSGTGGVPSWWPSWIPTNKELTCFMGLTKPGNVPQSPTLPQPTLVAPRTMEEMTQFGQWTPELVATLSKAKNEADAQQAIRDWEHQIEVQGYYEPTPEGQKFGNWTIVALAGGAIVLAVLLTR